MRPAPGKKGIPLITKGDPPIPFAGFGVPAPSPETLPHLPIIEQWRRYDRSIFGQLIMPDGRATPDTVKLKGLFISCNVREGWVAMDTGEYYRLGNRAYAGT